MSPSMQRVLAVAAPALYYVMLSSMALTFQLWGGPQELGRFAIMGFLAGLVCSGLALPAVQRHFSARESSGTLRFALPFCLLALVLFSVWGFDSGAVTRSLLVFLIVGLCVGLLLTPSTWLFFVHAPARSRGLLYGAALACAQACWALLSPLVNGPAEGALFQETAGRYLTLLSLMSGLSGLGLVYALWQLLPCPLPAAWGRSRTAPERPEEYDGPAERPKSATRAGIPLWPLFLPVLLCFFLNGLLNFQFSARFQSRLAVSPEYVHILLAVGMPLLGAFLDSKGDALLRRALAVCVCCFAVGPLTLMLPESSPVSLAVRMACAMAAQGLYFLGTLSCARFAPQRRFPALVATAAWLGIGGAIAGGLTARFVFSALPLPPLFWAWAAAGLCLAAVVPLLRASLPALPAEPVSPEPAAPGPAATNPAVNRIDAARLAAFVLAHGLSEGEKRTLELLAEGRSTAEIAAALSLKESTVRTVVHRTLQKTGMENRAALMRALDHFTLEMLA